MNLTYEEQERLAYISGDTQKAALLAKLIDSESALEFELDKDPYDTECPECGTCL